MDTFFTTILVVIFFTPAINVVSWFTWTLFRKLYNFLYGNKSIDFILLEIVNFLVPNIAFSALLIVLTGTKIVQAEMPTIERSKYLIVFLAAYFLMVFLDRVKEIRNKKDNER